MSAGRATRVLLRGGGATSAEVAPGAHNKILPGAAREEADPPLPAGAGRPFPRAASAHGPHAVRTLGPQEEVAIGMGNGQAPGRSGQEGTLEAEWEKHRPAVFGVAYRLLGSVADAEDVANPDKLSHL